ncbi:Flp family type IVb pilin [Sphingomonas sp. MMS24-J45]|uniref:Flp family type IVb pilin n=1 Tax=Sphingomonas sp. MMS24-J45 TaxID=3238806 RepID=UPI00384A7407
MIVGPFKRVLKDKRGGTAIEYGLIAALVVITMIAAFMEVANTTTGMWGNVNNKMANARAAT